MLNLGRNKWQITESGNRSSIYWVAVLACNRAETVSQIITKMVTGYELKLSFVEGGGFCELISFVEQECKPQSQKTSNARVETMQCFEKS